MNDAKSMALGLLCIAVMVAFCLLVAAGVNMDNTVRPGMLP